MQTSDGIRFFMETPETHESREAQAFIQQEITRPSKVWVQEVVKSDRESEFVKLRTDDFVLLPDLHGNRRQSRQFRPKAQIEGAGWNPQAARISSGTWHRWPSYQERRTQGWPSPGMPRIMDDSPNGVKRAKEHASAVVQAQSSMGDVTHQSSRRFNWLAIVADPSVKSIRDLRAEHIPMLKRLYEQCIHAIQMEYKVDAGDVMVFANYPPSVYRLHFHFCAPFYQPTAYDAFRMHSLSSIINNMEIHPFYYKISTFQIPIHRGSDLCKAIAPPGDDDDGDEGGLETHEFRNTS